jgi:hypothetical protein
LLMQKNMSCSHKKYVSDYLRKLMYSNTSHNNSRSNLKDSHNNFKNNYKRRCGEFGIMPRVQKYYKKQLENNKLNYEKLKLECANLNDTTNRNTLILLIVILLTI